MTAKRTSVTALSTVMLVSITGCQQKAGIPGNLSAGVVIEQTAMTALREELHRHIRSAAPRIMKGGGLVGGMGGARLKLLSPGSHEVLLPLPQLANAQVPVSYAITTTPPECGVECRVRAREDANVIVSVRLNGRRGQEIRIEWAAILLFSRNPVAPNPGDPSLFLRETACVQSGAASVTNLASRLWPESGKPDAYAANIQEFIRNLEQHQPPRAVDAVAVLDSGANGVCTANGNLAAALLRAKRLPARSIAVIPVTGQRLEMHRIVEYLQAGQWRKFDPSSLQPGIPLRPWQNVIMSTTTVADEEVAMTPRPGASVGCPFGQELELLDQGVTLWGDDFFWTVARPLAEFEASVDGINLARKHWVKFLETGRLSRGQINAGSTRTADDFQNALATE